MEMDIGRGNGLSRTISSRRFAAFLHRAPGRATIGTRFCGGWILSSKWRISGEREVIAYDREGITADSTYQNAVGAMCCVYCARTDMIERHVNSFRAMGHLHVSITRARC
jgi:hypothetical protein